MKKQDDLICYVDDMTHFRVKNEWKKAWKKYYNRRIRKLYVLTYDHYAGFIDGARWMKKYLQQKEKKQ